jgi:general secretion pathway protein F
VPVFEYVAIDARGKNVRGVLDADNGRVARQRLRAQGLFATEVHEAQDKTAADKKDVLQYLQSDKVSARDLSIGTRQLATLVTAGLPLVNALSALADQTDSPVFRKVIVAVREQVEEGTTLHRAMAEHPKAFPSLFVNMVAAGEASGTLDNVLNNLADYIESQVELRRKVRSALTYPILMLCVCILVILALFTFVIPRITEMFQRQNVALPLPTQITVAISYGLIHYWYLLAAALVATFFGIRSYYRKESGRKRVDKMFLRAPIFGNLYTKVMTARVTQTLGALLASGVGLLKAIDITRNIIENVHIVAALESAKEGVREGRSLANELSRSGLFPAMVSHMIAVGEKSGALEAMLTKVGDTYEKDVNASLDGLTSLLEPLLMIIVGMVVLCIVISVLLPMTEMINLVG